MVLGIVAKSAKNSTGRGHIRHETVRLSNRYAVYVRKEQNRTDEATNEGLDTRDDLSAVLDDKYKNGIERLTCDCASYVPVYSW